ncbi:MAG: hypothetical protein HXX13_16830 [Bacteroidetes bacterium]|nr:hypothetical protein [Bacteroidota bacterium]
MNTLLIDGKIGGGLVLYHCYYGVISPDTMGENCKVWHGVTIGFKNDLAPVIGNNVSISTGAVISGGLMIGDNVKIGPNSLIIKDIDSNCVVISDPGYVVKRDGKKVMEK